MITKYKIFKESLQKFNWSNVDIDDYVQKCIDIDDYKEIIETVFEIENVDELSTEEEFNYVKQIIEHDFEDIIGDIYDCVENTKTIYRAIKVPNDFNLEELINNPLGIYWTYDENYAEAHWGVGDKLITLKAEIQDSKDVDIESSILLNLAPHIGLDEKEIRMIKGSDVLLISIKDSDDIIEVNRIAKV